VTRARILDAVVRCIDDVGFPGATATRIAEAAGVSVGAVQHHFPTKADVLAAVLERSFENLQAGFEDVHTRNWPLERRVSVFVERAWRHYGSAAFRSTLEILLNERALAAGGENPTASAPIYTSARRATQLWESVFAGIDVPASRQREIRQFTFASLSGLAMARRLQPSEASMEAQVAMLEVSLLTLFEGALAELRGGAAR
jgi:AcrR family transcriptional regulator